MVVSDYSKLSLNSNNFRHKHAVIFFLRFSSIISPYLINNLKLLPDHSLLNKKILIKQSYVILTWFYYLNSVSTVVNPLNDKNKIRISSMPSSSYKFTLTKAPMAHKNWSKEQYKFFFYNFNLKLNFNLHQDFNLNSLNKGLLLLLISKTSLPNLETNILFLKTLSLSLYITDSTFFKV